MRPENCLLRTSSGRRPAFTLLELLVVIALLALLASLLAPALARTQPNGQAARCQNNHRQLIAAWLMYCADYGEKMPYNLHGAAAQGGAGYTLNGALVYGWAEGWCDWTTSTDNTNMSWLIGSKPLLAPYVAKASSIYKCPADVFLSPVQRHVGWSARVRSVTCNLYLGQGNVSSGPTDAIYRQQVQKLSDLQFPTVGTTWVFMDEHPDSINDPGLFAPHQTAWIDVPATYHNGATPVSFADGHLEMRKWTGSLTSLRARQVLYQDTGNGEITAGPNDPDIEWLAYRTPRLSATFPW